MSHNLEPIPNLTINAQSYLLVTCGNDSLVKLWRISLPNKCDTSIDKIEVKLWRSLQGHGGNVICVRFSQIVSEFVCSTATDRQARIWSVYSANCLYVLDHDSIVTSCCFNEDCSLLATGCLDKTLWLWKLPQHLKRWIQKYFSKNAANNVKIFRYVAFVDYQKALDNDRRGCFEHIKNQRHWRWRTKYHRKLILEAEKSPMVPLGRTMEQPNIKTRSDNAQQYDTKMGATNYANNKEKGDDRKTDIETGWMR
uniref:Coronin-2B-like n=1 Tax=Diabrotica virgifera virgifera TaxID=50390 RepID=A0A6P7GHU8_DIAVI